MTGKQSAQLRSSLELCEPHSQAVRADCRSTKEGPVDGDVGSGFGTQPLRTHVGSTLWWCVRSTTERIGNLFHRAFDERQFAQTQDTECPPVQLSTVRG